MNEGLNQERFRFKCKRGLFKLRRLLLLLLPLELELELLVELVEDELLLEVVFDSA